MLDHNNRDLSRRERQIMTVLFKRGTASVKDVAAGIPSPPTNTAIRTMLRILQDKGHVLRERDGHRHLYRPAVKRRRAARSALGEVLHTFFDDSLGDAVALHLADPSGKIDQTELDRLQRIIDEAREAQV